MSARTDARDAIYTRLQAAAVPAGALAGFTVEASRVDPIDDSDPSAAPQQVILVFGETNEPATQSAGYGARFVAANTVRINVVAMCCASTGSALETAMDAAEDGIEATLLADRTWLNLFAKHPTVRTQAYAVGFTPSGRLRGEVLCEIECYLPAREVV